MSAFLLRPFSIEISSISTPNGGNVSALLDPRPRIAWDPPSASGAWARWLDVDFGTDRELDTIALLFHNGSAGGLWRGFGRTAAQGPFGAYGSEAGADQIFAQEPWSTAPTVFTSFVHSLRTVQTPIARRYLRIELFWPGGAGMETFRAGVLAIGRRLQPGGIGGGFDWGGGRRVSDLSTVRVLQDGGRGIWRGAKVPEVRGTFSHLTDAELQALWALQLRVGESDPLLLVEAPDTLGSVGSQERMHYGTLVGLDFFERRQSDKSRVEIRLQHWL